MKKKSKKLPDFNKMSYKEEAEWWDTHSLADYWDEFKDVEIVWELNKPKDKTLVVRLPEPTKSRISKIARNRGVSTSALARMALEKMFPAN